MCDLRLRDMVAAFSYTAFFRSDWDLQESAHFRGSLGLSFRQESSTQHTTTKGWLEVNFLEICSRPAWLI